MARRKTIIEDDGDDRREATERVVFDPAEESFSQFRAKFGTEGVTVKVYRHTPRGLQYCFSGLPSEIDEEVVRLFHSKQVYAADEGDYAARCVVNGEARDSFPILIAPQLGAPGGNGSTNGASGGSDAVVRLLMAQNERLEQRLNMQSQQEREPFSSLADAMVKLQALTPKPPEMPLDLLMKAIDIGKQLGGAGAAADDWKPLIIEALKEAGPLLRSVVGGASVARNGAGGQPAAVAGGSEVEIERAMLAQTFNYLKRKCLAGSDPGLYIDIILDNRDEATYQKLIHHILTREFSEFVSVDPEIGKPPFLAFFLAIYDGLRSAATEANTVVQNPEGKSGDAANVGGDGKPRKVGNKKS